MGKVLTVQDCHNLMNSLVKQATGQQSITVIDSSSFVSAGETVLATGNENVINSLSLIIGRTLVAVRPYKAKFLLINALNSGVYSNRIRKISYYSKDAQPSGMYNTQLYTNLKEGYTNGQNVVAENPASTKSMWEQNQPIALEMNFAGSDTWDDSLTIYEKQLQVAFESEANFSQFMSGIMTEKSNDMESQKEAFNRMCVLNEIGMIYDMAEDRPMSCVNLTKEYNTKYGTSYTSAELRTTYSESFLKFFVACVKNISNYLEERSSNYHLSPTKTVNGTTYKLLRHTPKNRQKMFLYEPLFIEAKANVLPSIFNPEYLDIKNYEPVNYWQSIDDRSSVKITPAIYDKVSGEQKKGNEVDLDYVVGLLFDEDAMMIDYQFDGSYSTPLEARKVYRNIFWHYTKNAINDPTENAVLFYMKDDEV
jgi:hypothetical protein|nr:MAG TPA_asm: major capsid protein [Caudoviricetes sp.]